MSKHMQLTVKVRPYYKKGLKEVYPHIADSLSRLKSQQMEQDPSLADIVKNLDTLLYDLEGDHPFVEIMRKHRSELLDLYGNIETHIADWRLAEADKMLYRIEDIFDDIEWELDKARI